MKDLRRDQHFIFFVSRRYQEYMVSSACCGDNILYPTYTYVDQDLSNLNKWIDKTSTYWNLSIPEWFAFFLDGISFVISCVRVSVRRGTWDWEDGTFWWKVHESHELMINWKFRACWCLPYFSTTSVDVHVDRDQRYLFIIPIYKMIPRIRIHYMCITKTPKRDIIVCSVFVEGNKEIHIPIFLA